MTGSPSRWPNRPSRADPTDDWDAELDRIVAESVLARLPEPHRTVLALRYMDDCSVPRVRGTDRAHRARHRGAAGAGPARLQIISIRSRKEGTNHEPSIR